MVTLGEPQQTHCVCAFNPCITRNAQNLETEHEHKGIGKRLHDLMLDWYFSQTKETVWLGTAPNTRAEIFYRKSGWKETGRRANGEIKFEMTAYDCSHKDTKFTKPL